METMAKRILIFSTNYLPHIGGAEVAVREITSRLSSEYQCDIVVPKISPSLARVERMGVVTIYRVGFGLAIDKFIFPFLGFLKARSLHKHTPYSYIWSIMASQASIAASFFRMNMEIPLVLTLQEGDDEEHLRRYVFGNEFLYRFLIKPWHLLVFKKADVVTVISEYLKERALANGIECPIFVIPNGVDVTIFTQKISESKQRTLISKLGKEPQDTLLITVSRLVAKNGVRDIVGSLKYLPETVKLIIIGVGAEFERIRTFAEDIKVRSRVQFLGAMGHQEIAEYLSVGDIFVRPSLSEGFGNVFLEAMASGLPVIGTPVGGIVDFIQDKKTGLFVEPEQSEDIAEKVRYLIEHEPTKKRIAQVGQRLALQEYDWNTIAKEMTHVFDTASIQKIIVEN